MPGETECRVRVLGLGTPFGDDRAGWEVIVRLRAALPGLCSEQTSDPLAVIDTPPSCELLIVIDAVRGAGPVSSLHRFEWPDVRLTASASVSSHGVELTQALELAAALGKLPPRVVLFAIEGASTAPDGGLSSAVEAAIPDVVTCVLKEIVQRTR